MCSASGRTPARPRASATIPTASRSVLEAARMRGVVSAGMTAALERLGLTRCFDLVVGASAGAINGAALIAGPARQGAATYHGPLASPSFVNPARVLPGRLVLDVNYALNYASSDLDAARHERVLDNPIALHCVAVSVETAQPVDMSGMRSKGSSGRPCWRRAACPGPAAHPSDRRPAPSTGSRLSDPRRGKPSRRAPPTCSPCRRGRTACRAQARLADRRPPDRAAPAEAQPCTRDALPRASGLPTSASSTTSPGARSRPTPGRRTCWGAATGGRRWSGRSGARPFWPSRPQPHERLVAQTLRLGPVAGRRPPAEHARPW